MINILRKKILKKGKFGFCLLKDLEENFSNEKEDPYKQFLFDFEYTQKKLKQTEMFMLPIDYKKNILKQKLKGNHSQDLYLKYKPRVTKKIKGLKNDIYDLEDKINDNEINNSFYDRFDFQIELNKEISQLNKHKNYEIKQQANKYLNNVINDKLDYIQIGLDFQEVLQRFKREQNLKENEIIIYNFPIKWKPVQCINLLNDRVKDIQQVKVKINELGQVTYVLLEMKNQESVDNVQNLNDLDVERSTLKTYVQGQEELDYNERIIVIENLQDDIDEEYLYLTASQYGKIDKIFFMKEMQLGQLTNTTNFIQHINENFQHYENYFNISVKEISKDQQKEIKIYEKGNKFEKYQEILSKNMQKNRDLNQELKILSEQELEDQKLRISKYFNQLKITTIKDYIQDDINSNEQKQNQILLKKNDFNNFGVYEKSLNTAIICFASKQDAQKGIYGIKFIEKLSKQINLFNKSYLHEYIPQFKYQVYFDALKQHENFSQEQTFNEDNIEREKIDKNLKQQLYENWKEVLPDEFQRKVFAQEAYNENNIFDKKNQFIQRSIDISQVNQKLQLKQKLKQFLDEYAEENLFSKDNNLNDQLGSIQDNQKVNKLKGRDFGTNQLRQATIILKERLQKKEQKNFSFFQQILNDFKDISTNEILAQLQSISYEEGIKEAIDQHQLKIKTKKQIKKNQEIIKKFKVFYKALNLCFLFIIINKKNINKKFLINFFSSNLKLQMEIILKNKIFRTILFKAQSVNKLSNLKSQFDKFADVLHIENLKGERFFSEQDVKEVEHQIYGEELSKFKNWEKNEKNLQYLTQTPENIVSSYLDKDFDMANQYFEGLTTKLYKYKPNKNSLESQQLIQKLNENNENKTYDFFKQSDTQYYIIEKVKLFNENIPQIFECLQEFYQNIILQVAIKNNITSDHLVNCLYKQIKNDQESKSVKDLIAQNSIKNQIKHLNEKRFSKKQIEQYYNLTEQQLHKQLQYYYELQERERDLKLQNKKIEQLKIQDAKVEQDDINKRTATREHKQSESLILKSVQYDLERQRRLFQKKIKAYTRLKEREQLNEGIEKNLKGEVVEDIAYTNEEKEIENELFNEEMELLFERSDDIQVETTKSDHVFDIDEDASQETIEKTIKSEIKSELYDDIIDQSTDIKLIKKTKEISQKLGSKELVYDVDSDVLKDRSSLEKEFDKFKND